ncbi:hypothetical protein [Paraburkholderia sediminicola]|uniref:hypothetical protein n=1 Tax=Paraburkholderia sediminicola TaxID=458836 RepID=UPI0038BDDC40
MKRPWDPVKLRVDGWTADIPCNDDEIVTTTGRRYRILDVGLKDGRIRRLDCMVLPPDAPLLGRQFEWLWTPRGKKSASHNESWRMPR